MSSRTAFSLLGLLIALAVMIVVLALVPARKNVKRYHDPADDYITRDSNNAVKDIYGSDE